MPHPTARNGAPQGADDLALLDELLASELPSRQGQPRAARLRSAAQQQQIALRGFLLKNKVDRALHFAERVLVLAAVIAFGYWLYDGPVRDWLHARREANIVWADASRVTPTPPIAVPGASSVAGGAGVADAPAAPAASPVAASEGAPAPLPFTRPDEAGSAPAAARSSRDEFMVPQGASGVVVADDPRPVRLNMPSIGAVMDVREIYVIDGEWEVAEYAAGYHNGSALPGNVGNSVFSGHAGLRGAVFKDLGRLQPGDDVIVETPRWRYTYRVRGSQNVWPTQVEVMDPTPTPTLTLITCTNWDTQRLVVVADLVDARPLS